jgi:nucleoside-diphosphate-sugar epimerase
LAFAELDALLSFSCLLEITLPSTSMKLLVTGANGFVGKSLCVELSRRGHIVRAASRAATDVFLGLEQTMTGSVGPGTNWHEALNNIEVVIHLAARVHVMNDTAVDPLAEFRNVNVVGSLNLAHQAASMGVKRFVFVSSVKVNGEFTLPGRAFNELDTAAPQDAYGLSKHEAEMGLRQIAMATGMEVVIVRPPLVYGPGVKANFAALMHAVQRGWPLPLGAVHNQRSLVSLRNLVDFIGACVLHPRAANQTFLISDGHDLSAAELVQGLARAASVSARLLPVPVWVLQAAAVLAGKGDMMKRICGNLQVDISKARNLLGWVPPVSVNEGLLLAVAGRDKV